jgi:hypothetical protein
MINIDWLSSYSTLSQVSLSLSPKENVHMFRTAVDSSVSCSVRKCTPDIKFCLIISQIVRLTEECTE